MNLEERSTREHASSSAPEVADTATKKRKAEDDACSQRFGRLYERNVVQDNAQVHFGDCINTYNLCPGQHTQASFAANEAIVNGTQDAARLIEALQFDEMEDRIATVGAAHADTCGWFFERREYKAWRDPKAFQNHHGFLWIKGKPGSGKSTLLKRAYTRGLEEFDQDVILAFFFSARGVKLQRSTEGMYRSLLCQLLEKMPHLVSELPARKCKRLQQQGWPLDLLKDVLNHALLLLGSKRLTCYVDALDECNDSEAWDMIRFFELVSRSAAKSGARIFVLLSSRHYPYMRISKCTQLILERQDGHGSDISAYVKSELQIGVSEAARDIQKEVQRKAAGVFLWVVLVVRILNEQKHRGLIHELAESLEKIPKDLDALFAEILLSGDEETPYLFPVLQWVAFASRPLKREEIYHAVVYQSSDSDHVSKLVEECCNEDMDMFILDASRGLAETSRGMQPTVQFIHESVRSYLLDTGLKMLSDANHGSLTAACHENLKQRCYDYLKSCAHKLLPLPADGLKEKMPQGMLEIRDLQRRTIATSPFLSYALDGMLAHADCAHVEGISQLHYISGFPCYLWSRMYNLLATYHRDRLSREVDVDYILVLKSAYSLAAALIDNVDSRVRWNNKASAEHHTTLLGLATDLSDHAMLDILLRGGASPDSYAKDGQRCVHLAIGKGDYQSARRLIDAGAWMDFQRRGEANELSLAVVSGNLDMVHLLLYHPRLSHGWRPAFDRAIREALRRYQNRLIDIGIVRMLLTSRTRSAAAFVEESKHHMNAADAPFHPNRVRQLLFNSAIARCDLSAVEWLLGEGALIDEEALKQSMHAFKSHLIGYGTSKREEYIQIIELLFDRQVDYRCSDPDRAFFSLSHLRFVEFLLDRGPNILDTVLSPEITLAKKSLNSPAGAEDTNTFTSSDECAHGIENVNVLGCDENTKAESHNGYSAIRDARVAAFFPIAVTRGCSSLVQVLLDRTLHIKHRDKLVGRAFRLRDNGGSWWHFDEKLLRVLLDWCTASEAQSRAFPELGRLLIELVGRFSHACNLIEMILDSKLDIAASVFCEAYHTCTHAEYNKSVLSQKLLKWALEQSGRNATFASNLGFTPLGDRDDMARLAGHMEERAPNEPACFLCIPITLYR